MEKAKETGEINHQEAPVVDTEGNELWFHSTIVPVSDDGVESITSLLYLQTLPNASSRTGPRGVDAEASVYTVRCSTMPARRLTGWPMRGLSMSMIWTVKSLGYTREELMQMAVCDIDPISPAEDWQEHWGEMREQGVKRFEARHK